MLESSDGMEPSAAGDEGWREEEEGCRRFVLSCCPGPQLQCSISVQFPQCLSQECMRGLSDGFVIGPSLSTM